jgi:hypothetical protein
MVWTNLKWFRRVAIGVTKVVIILLDFIVAGNFFNT